jgi:hypothetical protein
MPIKSTGRFWPWGPRGIAPNPAAEIATPVTWACLSAPPRHMVVSGAGQIL